MSTDFIDGILQRMPRNEKTENMYSLSGGLKLRHPNLKQLNLVEGVT